MDTQTIMYFCGGFIVDLPYNTMILFGFFPVYMFYVGFFALFFFAFPGAHAFKKFYLDRIYPTSN